jgi:hypothetical protein
MNWQIRKGTSNAKLGPDAWVVTLDRSTCPSTCPLKGAGCYAESGPLAIAWRRVSAGLAKDDGRTRWAGKGFRALARTLQSLPIPSGALLRIGDAGDPSHRGTLSVELVRALIVLRRRGVRVIVYTHAPDTVRNRATIKAAAEAGLVINRSVHGAEATRPEEPFEVLERVTTVTPSFWVDGNVRTVDGTLIVRCPAETRATSCVECGLCARSRGFVIGFTGHGSAKGKMLGASL